MVGHNGAGKSTLIKMLSGTIPLDEGSIFIDGKPVTIKTSPCDAKSCGIETIYQNSALADNLDATAN